ncbi:hypothetical protein TSUD_336260 [Trifolium subterraneum]|uniref:Uncharacterized protein n=1 Tax=Trifolium subterraneum TaxID=3900 RepID=A0A2Z6LML1_TRISU|nr:hypothetical protein TSUD_336260 [Trifolium subterraneum]
MGTGLCRFLGAVGREMTVATTLASFIICFIVAMGGMTLSRGTTVHSLHASSSVRPSVFAASLSSLITAAQPPPDP